jgi:hypothetical protein
MSATKRDYTRADADRLTTEMNLMFGDFNAMYFEGRLPAVPVKVSRRLGALRGVYRTHASGRVYDRARRGWRRPANGEGPRHDLHCLLAHR